MNELERQALLILDSITIYKTMLCSPSQKHHHQETLYEHSILCSIICKHLCLEFNINENDTDMLVAASLLHDIGRAASLVHGKINNVGWKYYENTNISQFEYGFMMHPIIGSYLLDKYNLNRKEEIKKLISTHMSHWLPNNPQPTNLFEYIICLSDYIAAKKEDLYTLPNKR